MQAVYISIIGGIFSVGLILLFTLVVHVPAPTEVITVTYPSSAFVLSTDVWGVFDPDTGVVLAGNNIDQTRPIASITKLFTAHAVMQAGEVDVPVEVTWSDITTEGRAGKLAAGDILTRRELLFPLLIESSNDAGVALQRSLGDSYDSLLTETIRKLSLAHTHITDPSGLDQGNASTVHDIAAFTSYVRTEEPYLFDITRLSMYVGEDTGWINNNPVHKIPGYKGGKHGYTPEAGRTFVGVFHLDSINRDVGVVVLGSVDLKKDVTDILGAIQAHAS